MQEILDPLTEIILEQQGVVHDYQDARVRFLGARSHWRFRRLAAKAAALMIERLPDLAARRTDRGK